MDFIGLDREGNEIIVSYNSETEEYSYWDVPDVLNDMRARAFYFSFQKRRLQSTWHVARDMQAVLPCPRFVDNPNQNFYMRYATWTVC